MDETAHEHHGHDLTVTVENEDNGRQYTLHGGQGTPIAALIDELYSKLKVSRQPDDRLRCASNNEDVFPLAGMTLGAYVESGHCPDLFWKFAGGTGGA